MTDFAFHFENNKSFFNDSIKLSRIYNEKEEKIIKNLDYLNNFTMG